MIDFNSMDNPELKQEILERIIQNIFGLNAGVKPMKCAHQGCIEIKDIVFTSDLLTVLQRLRKSFYVELDTEISPYTYTSVNGHKIKSELSQLNLELYPKEECFQEISRDSFQTSDGKKWIYDSKNHSWVDVSLDNPKLKKLVEESVEFG